MNFYCITRNGANARENAALNAGGGRAGNVVGARDEGDCAGQEDGRLGLDCHARTGCINDIQVPECNPQGLKPLIIPASFGTTEVVP